MKRPSVCSSRAGLFVFAWRKLHGQVDAGKVRPSDRQLARLAPRRTPRRRASQSVGGSATGRPSDSTPVTKRIPASAISRTRRETSDFELHIGIPYIRRRRRGRPVEAGDGVPGLVELGRGGEARGTGADDGDLLPGPRGGDRRGRPTLVERLVAIVHSIDLMSRVAVEARVQEPRTGGADAPGDSGSCSSGGGGWRLLSTGPPDQVFQVGDQLWTGQPEDIPPISFPCGSRGAALHAAALADQDLVGRMDVVSSPVLTRSRAAGRGVSRRYSRKPAACPSQLHSPGPGLRVLLEAAERPPPR